MRSKSVHQRSTNVIGGTGGAEIDIMENAWLTDHFEHARHLVRQKAHIPV
jgi:hypothetical protein